MPRDPGPRNEPKRALKADSIRTHGPLTRSQAEAWSRHGVCCNALVPGFVHTPLTAAVQPERPTAYASRTMVGRNGVPADFAGTAVYLTSPASDYVTGQALFVDGGFSAT